MQGKPVVIYVAESYGFQGTIAGACTREFSGSKNEAVYVNQEGEKDFCPKNERLNIPSL
jgi:hypothetical protein